MTVQCSKLKEIGGRQNQKRGGGGSGVLPMQKKKNYKFKVAKPAEI